MTNRLTDNLAECLITREERKRAVTQVVEEAVRRHKERGNSIAVWQDGRVVIVPAEEIVLSPDITTESVLPDSPLPLRQPAKERVVATASK